MDSFSCFLSTCQSYLFRFRSEELFSTTSSTPGKFSDTSYYTHGKSCQLKVGNTMLIFGGEFEKRQIIQLYPGGYHRFLTLDFDFEDGSCHYFGGFVFLCFSQDGRRECRKSMNLRKFDEIRSSTNEHYNGEMVTLNNQMIAIAGTSTLNIDVYTPSGWDSDLISPVGYPIWTSNFGDLSYFSALSIPMTPSAQQSASPFNEESLYIFGGYFRPPAGDMSNGASDNIFRYFNKEWTMAMNGLSKGKLKMGRKRHRSFLIGNDILHIGGYLATRLGTDDSDLSVERWRLDKESNEIDFIKVFLMKMVHPLADVFPIAPSIDILFRARTSSR